MCMFKNVKVKSSLIPLGWISVFRGLSSLVEAREPGDIGEISIPNIDEVDAFYNIEK